MNTALKTSTKAVKPSTIDSKPGGFVDDIEDDEIERDDLKAVKVEGTTTAVSTTFSFECGSRTL